MRKVKREVRNEFAGEDSGGRVMKGDIDEGDELTGRGGVEEG